jgi:diguanylate cyclase (GGDEF)-like protein
MSPVLLVVIVVVVILVGAGLGYGLAAVKFLAELHAAKREKLELQRQLNAAPTRNAPTQETEVRGQGTGVRSQESEQGNSALGSQSMTPAKQETVKNQATPKPDSCPLTPDSRLLTPDSGPPTSDSQPGTPAKETALDAPTPAESSWQQLIHEAAQRAQSDVLCIVDVDYLRQYRERYGQDLGSYVSDHVLRVMQDSLRESLPEGSAIISRYEGQEFILSWPAVPGTAAQRIWAARKVTARLRADIEQAFLQVGSERLTITASIGLALCEPGLAGEQIIARADEALTGAKKAGRNRGFYHDGSECRAVEPLDAEAELAAGNEPKKDKDKDKKARRNRSSGRERRRHERKACDNINLIAPCTDGVLPGMDKFQRVQFFDISSSGFSMIVPTVPAANQFAVALINSRGMIFMAAEVANVRQAPRAHAGSKPLLIIGCKFLQRLYPEGAKVSPRQPAAALA